MRTGIGEHAHGTLPLQSSSRNQSTTMAFGQLLAQLMKDERSARGSCPIVADEARTFGIRRCSGSSASTRRSGSSTSPRTRGAALLREAKTPDLEEGITRRRAFIVVAAGDLVFVARHADLPFLHLLLDLRFQRVAT